MIEENKHDHPLLFGLLFEANHAGTSAKGETLVHAIKSDQLAWAHLDAENEHTESWLKEHVPYLDALAIDALLADETRPRFEEIGDGALIILRGINLNENAAPEDMISIRLWVDSHRIISIQRRPLKAVQDIRQRLLSGKGPGGGAGGFITGFIMQLLERMDPTLGQLDERMDDLEETILGEADIKLRSQIVSLRREAIILRRYIAPQRDAINRMRSSELAWLEGKPKRKLQEAWDRFTRHVEDLDTIRERSQIVQDELTTALADKLNRNMYVLSVIAAIFLPLGFMTGLLGVNIGGIPGTEDASAFTIFCVMMVILVIIQIILFKKFKWF
jgi:zinc transporter